MQIVRDYLAATVPGNINYDRVRELVTDDVVVSDTLMGETSGGDNYVEQLRSYGESPPLEVTVVEVTATGDVAAALLELSLGPTKVSFGQFFWLRDGKIARIQVIYDPRPFLAMRPDA